MKLKMIAPGFENFSGLFGCIDLEDGVSVDHVGLRDARRLAGVLAMVDAETGLDPSVTQHIVNSQYIEAPVLPEVALDEKPPAEVAVQHTQAGLEAVADLSGIKGLREVGDALGVKSSSIPELIERILAKQAAIATAAKASAAQPPAVEAGIGNRAIPFGDDIIGDQAKWEKASEAERLRMLS